MVVGVLVFLEEPVCLKAPPTNNFVDLEGANMAIGILLSVEVPVSQTKVAPHPPCT